jgi:hypothetical protein
MAATAPPGLSEVTPAILESQLKGLSHLRTREGALATLLLLLPRLDDAHAPLLEPHVATLAGLLEGGGGGGEGENGDAPGDTVQVWRRGPGAEGGPEGGAKAGRRRMYGAARRARPPPPPPALTHAPPATHRVQRPTPQPCSARWHR